MKTVNRLFFIVQPKCSFISYFGSVQCPKFVSFMYSYLLRREGRSYQRLPALILSGYRLTLFINFLLSYSQHSDKYFQVPVYLLVKSITSWFLVYLDLSLDIEDLCYINQFLHFFLKVMQSNDISVIKMQ